MKIGDRVWVWDADGDHLVIASCVVSDVARFDSGKVDQIYAEIPYDGDVYTQRFPESDIHKTKRSCLEAAKNALWGQEEDLSDRSKKVWAMLDDVTAQLAEIDGEAP